MDSTEKYEQNKYCLQCGEDGKLFMYRFTCSSGEVFNCKNCNTERVIGFKPNI